MNRQKSTIAALGGHGKDLWNMARFKVANPHSWSKYRQLKAVGKRTGAKMLVETGTFLGNTSMRCSKVFDQVVTIELDPDLHEHAKSFLSKRENVECILGDATVKLPEVLARDNCKEAELFLDGHFSSGETAHGDIPEPACELLDSLAQFREKICGIVVDDFRLFGVEAGWPKKSELISSAEQHFPGYRLSVHLDQLLIEQINS